jgi:hypothetical protein
MLGVIMLSIIYILETNRTMLDQLTLRSDLKPLAEVGHGVGGQPRPSGHEYHEEHFVLFAHFILDSMS